VGGMVALVVAAAGAAWIARAELAAQRESFDTAARIAHRLLSQRAVEHEAILGTLALLQPSGDDDGAAVQRLIALYPQLLRVERRARDGRWPEAGAAAWDEAEARSRATSPPRAVLASADAAKGRFVILRAGEPASFALEIDLARMVPWADWPIAPEQREQTVRASLQLGAQAWPLHGAAAPMRGPWPLAASKALAADSQSFELRIERTLGLSALPWGRMAAWVAFVAVLMALAAMLQRQREARRRAEQLRRLDQVARLGTLGEIGAGLAHELNQPLAALMASTQAAKRLLDDETPDLATAREAVAHATAQARRAADVVQRLRRSIEPGAEGGAATSLQPVRLDLALRNALELVEPELRRLNVALQPNPATLPALEVRADPVGVDQVLHNLLANALQALERSDDGERVLTLALARDGTHARLDLRDNGPGIAPEALPHLFEPFYTTREGGLGLGLSLSLSLAERFGGTLSAKPAAPRGAEFSLALPLAAAPA
jgi:C4-dicarboxylate-specific signal transduction histidine kinase